MTRTSSDLLSSLRVAVVHDWLYTVGGAERVLASILKCFPGADLYALFDVLPEGDRGAIGGARAATSFLARMPGIARRHRLYLPLMPLAIEQFDLSGYDLVISSSFAVAKGVITGPGQVHVSYVHSPMRYAWDLQHQYLAESNLTRGLKGAAARLLLHHMRMWDTRTGAGVDAYAANSEFVARRVRKLYGRSAEVIHPPVAIAAAASRDVAKGDYFLTASRFVPYKNIRVIAEAFAALPDRKLVIVGDGPDRKRIEAASGPNVELRGRVSDEELTRLMAGAQAFIFAAEEDFGIVPVEAQAAGTPVIALGRGGALETVVSDGPAPTGMFFDAATPGAIAEAVASFDPSRFRPEDCIRQAGRFSPARFEASFRGFVRRAVIEARGWSDHDGTGTAASADDHAITMDGGREPARAGAI